MMAVAVATKQPCLTKAWAEGVVAFAMRGFLTEPYVCVYVCMHVCMHVRVHVYMHIRMHVCMHEYMHACIYASIYMQYMYV